MILCRFACGRGLGKGVDDGSIERLLVAELITNISNTDGTCNILSMYSHLCHHDSLTLCFIACLFKNIAYGQLSYHTYRHPSYLHSNFYGWKYSHFKHYQDSSDLDSLVEIVE